MESLRLLHQEDYDVPNIIAAVSEVFGVNVEDIKDTKRRHDIVDARDIAMFLVSRLHPRLSQVQIGEVFNGRDHSTVAVALTRASRLAKEDPDFLNQIKDICRELNPESDELFEILRKTL